MMILTRIMEHLEQKNKDSIIPLQLSAVMANGSENLAANVSTRDVFGVKFATSVNN